MPQNMLGAYGEWAAGILGDEPAELSFRRTEWRDINAWRDRARTRYRDFLIQADTGGTPNARLQHRFEYDGLDIEHLSWQLPYGPPTEAIFLKPAGAKGPCRASSVFTITAAISISAHARSPASAATCTR